MQDVAATKTDKWKYLGFNDTWLLIIGIPILSIIADVLFISEPKNNWTRLHRIMMMGIWFSGMYWLSMRFFLQKLRKRYYHFEDTIKRIAYILIIILIFAPIGSAILAAIFAVIAKVANFNLLELRSKQINVLAIYGLCFFMAAIYEVIYIYHQLKISIQEKEQAKQAHINSELAGLRNQVNPHFLFNSMNTLMNIVIEDQQLAVSFLKKLSKVYRYVLESREVQTIPLSQELEFIYSYVFLQKERFKGSLEVIIDIPQQYLDRHIVPLSLQILFENAIKHNIVSRRKPLLIEATVQGGKLRIRNNLQRKDQIMDSTKVGLKNIKTRYRFFTEETIDINEDEQFFSVNIPLLVY